MTRASPSAPASPGEDPPRPDASVVVAFHGRRDKTLACLESLLSQQGAAAEIILVDDGSADDTADAVAQRIARGTALPTFLLRNARNLGANPSRNRGVAQARGGIVVFIDSDCTANAGWLAALLAPFDDPAVGAQRKAVEGARRHGKARTQRRRDGRLQQRITAPCNNGLARRTNGKCMPGQRHG